MTDFEINSLGSIGVIQDQPAHLLPPEAWTLVENARSVDGFIEKLRGQRQVFGTPPVAPHFLLHLVDPSQAWWLYTSLTKAYVFNGTVHTNITRSSGGDYNAPDSHYWDATILGGIPIITNQNDAPQYWADYDIGTNLARLPNWPADTTARAIKAFGPYLVAVYINKPSGVFPHLVKWSHPAEVGSVPSSWDETDEAVDAGENDLPDTKAGMLLNLGTLRGQMYLYKEGAVWRMQIVGGRAIFKFDTFVESNGLLGQKSFCLTPDGLLHGCMFQDDIIAHDGQQVRSILDKRMRRALYNRIDPVTYKTCFAFPNPQYNEIWFCYPERGNAHPNRAVIWNITNGALTEATVNFRCTDVGVVETLNPDTWDTAVGTWDTYEGPWSTLDRRRVVVGNVDTTKLLQLDVGALRDNVNYPVRVQRTQQAIMGQDRDGKPINDYKRMKMYRKMWIKASGAPFRVRFGTQLTHDSPIVWTQFYNFDPSAQQWVDFIATGRLVAIDFSSLTGGIWAIHGYKPEVVPLGHF